MFYVSENIRFIGHFLFLGRNLGDGGKRFHQRFFDSFPCIFLGVQHIPGHTTTAGCYGRSRVRSHHTLSLTACYFFSYLTDKTERPIMAFRPIHYHSSTAFTVCAFYLLSSSLSSLSSSNTNTAVSVPQSSGTLHLRPPSAYQLLRVIPGQRNRYVVHLYASSSANSPFSRFVRLTVSLTTTVCPPTTPDIMLCEEPCRSRQQHFANHIKVTEARQ